MAFLGRGKKEDLQVIAFEMGIENTESMKFVELRKAIIENDNYEEDFVKEFLNGLKEERLLQAEENKRKDELEEKRRKIELELEAEEKKRKYELEAEEKRRKDELEAEEKKRKDELRKDELEIEERKRRFEVEAEERRRTQEMDFELQKMRLQNETKPENNQVTELFKPKVELHNILQKFDPKTNEISLYLVLFERQAKRVGIKKEHFVSHLIGLLPFDVVQIIAREEEETSEDYDKVKELLLKRFKMTPEKFRQYFVKHYKKPETSWVDFAYELSNYFNEWIKGMEIKSFEQICELMITDQIKRKVPPEIKEHFIDEWSNFRTPNELSSKLDDYENVRSHGNSKPTDFSNREQRNQTETKYTPPNSRQQEIRSFKKEENFSRRIPSCYICNESHYARVCPKRFINQDIQKKNDVLTAEIRFEPTWNKSKVERSPLQYVEVLIDNKVSTALVDSGCQIPVVNSSLVSKSKSERGKIVLASAFGERIDADLMSFQIKMKNEKSTFSEPIEIIAAVTSKIQEQCIIPPNILSSFNSKGVTIATRAGQNEMKAEKKQLEFEEEAFCGQIVGDATVQRESGHTLTAPKANETKVKQQKFESPKETQSQCKKKIDRNELFIDEKDKQKLRKKEKDTPLLSGSCHVKNTWIDNPSALEFLDFKNANKNEIKKIRDLLKASKRKRSVQLRCGRCVPKNSDNDSVRKGDHCVPFEDEKCLRSVVGPAGQFTSPLTPWLPPVTQLPSSVVSLALQTPSCLGYSSPFIVPRMIQCLPAYSQMGVPLFTYAIPGNTWNRSSYG